MSIKIWFIRLYNESDEKQGRGEKSSELRNSTFFCSTPINITNYIFKHTLTINKIFPEIWRNSQPFHLLFFVQVLPLNHKGFYPRDLGAESPNHNHTGAVHQVSTEGLHSIHWGNRENTWDPHPINCTTAKMSPFNHFNIFCIIKPEL